RAGVTPRLVQAIEAAGLLVERAIRIKVEGEEDRQVAGLRVIDEAALNKLDDAAFNTLRASGALPLAYAALLSWANFRQGPIGKSHMLPKQDEQPHLTGPIL
ncbi:MAG: SapC family protein, partial [Alphaproteobacteria bacterium]